MEKINEVARMQKLAGILTENNQEVNYLLKSIDLINKVGLDKMKDNYKKMEEEFYYLFGNEGEIDTNHGTLHVEPLTSDEYKEAMGYLYNQLDKVTNAEQLVILISDRSSGEFDLELYKEIQRAATGKSILDF